MQRSDHAGGVARSFRSGAMRTTALALALATGLGGAVALMGNSLPATAQIDAPTTEFLTPTTFSSLAEHVGPAVVAVQVEGARGDSRFRGGDSEDFSESLPPQFRDFFERFFDNPQGFEHFDRRGGGESRPIPRLAQGSGFLISADGYIVTNEHVVDGAGEITVVDHEGNEYPAQLVGQDPRTDLAVLKIESDSELPYVEFAGTAEEAKVGEWVMAVGNPFGLGGTVTTGIVSARGRNIGTGPYDDFIQIDAAVNRGNSGGPTFNLDGKVIGVNTAIYSPTGGSVGIGFAIPASIASRVVDQLIEHGEITRGWLGVSIQNVSPDIAESLGLAEAEGALIAEVFEDGPAEASGLAAGDVVLKVDGKPIETTRDLAVTVADIVPGATSTLTVHRDGADREITVEIGTMPENPELASAPSKQLPGNETGQAEEHDRLAELGLAVEPASVTEGDSEARGVVVTDVAADSEASEKGISAGDRILRVAGVEVNTPAELNKALEEASDDGLSSVLVLVRSRDGQRFVTLELTRA